MFINKKMNKMLTQKQLIT